MPKAKPTSVVVHRIELQETERTIVETALAGQFVTNALSGVGSVLSGAASMLGPFSGAITAIAALWLADKTFEEVVDFVEDVRTIRSNLEQSHGIYDEIVATLTATYETSGFEYLNSGGRSISDADSDTRNFIRELFDRLVSEYGPFNYFIQDQVLFACYRAKEQTEGRLLETPEGGMIPRRTPAEWFTYEFPIESWEAANLQWNLRNQG